MPQEFTELKAACVLIERYAERYARSIGRNCEIIFTDTGVQIAPLDWSGDVTRPTLFEALIEAKRESL